MKLLTAFAWLVVGWLALPGCILLVAAPFTIQNEFNEKRAALKEQVERGAIPREAGEAECIRMLGQVGRGMVAPPPVSPDVCKFGSFADKRYELTLLVQKVTLSPESWVRECRALAEKPSSGDPCKYDPVGESIAEWKRLIAEGRTTKQAAELDCQKTMKASKGSPSVHIDEICQL